MKKITLSLASMITLFFAFQLTAMQEETSLDQTDHLRHIISRYPAHFWYLRFANRAKIAKSFQKEEMRKLNIDAKTSIAKIKNILTYDNQIYLLEDEINEATTSIDDINIDDINKIIISFHPVKALRLKQIIFTSMLSIAAFLWDAGT